MELKVCRIKISSAISAPAGLYEYVFFKLHKCKWPLGYDKIKAGKNYSGTTCTLFDAVILKCGNIVLPNWKQKTKP
jgi:hypothetical protein